MEVVPSVLLPVLLLVLLSPVATPSAVSPAPDGNAPDVYIVFVRRADYVDSAAYDIRLLASVLESTEAARTAMIYHYGGLGFAARLDSGQADRLSKMEGVAVLKGTSYNVERDGRLPRFFKENVLRSNELQRTEPQI